MKAIGKNIVITEIVEQIENEIGLIITNSLDSNVRYKKAKVITCGDAVSEIKKGDVVYYDSMKAFQVRYNADKFLVIDESGIIIKN